MLRLTLGALVRTNSRSWLAVAAVGFFLSAAQAVVRPNFQVSDEVAYFSGAQWGAIEATARRAALVVAPPAGQYAHEPPSGKPLWQAGAGRLLAFLAPLLGPASSVTAFRLIGALSVALTAALTLLAARRLLVDEAVAVAAGLLVATHPVFAAHTAAMTPDLAVFGLGAATVSLGAAARRRSTACRLAAGTVIAILAAVAFALKDTGVIVALPVVFLALPPRHETAPWAGWVLLALGSGVVATAAVAAVTSGGPSVSAQVTGGSLADMPTQLANLLVTFWASLGNLGANEVPLPRAAIVLPLVASGLAGAGIVRMALVDAPASTGRPELTAAAIIAIAACLPSIARWQFQAHGDVLQAKWVFPAMPVLAILTVQGLAAWTRTPARWLPLFATVAVGSAVLFLTAVLVPYYYAQFPATLREASLYLGGSYGIGTDPDVVRRFIVPPVWLDSRPRLAVLVVAVTVPVMAAMRFAWRVGSEARVDGSPSPRRPPPFIRRDA